MPFGVTWPTLQSMTNILPPAEELRLLDSELWQLDARRAQLLARRAWLVAALQPPRPAPAPSAVARPRPETGASGVQNFLLLLGGVLLTIAAAVFTLVSWGHLGIAGRALVLGAVTSATLGAPVLLLRRGLRSTAESVAGLGLALMVLDAYALWQAAFTETGGAGYTAVASALLAVLWTAYGLLPRTNGLRLPLPCALVPAQLPLYCWAMQMNAGSYVVTAALLATAAFDAAVALRVTAGSVRVVAAIGAYGVGSAGVLAAGWLSWTASGPGAAGAAGLLLLGAAIALGAAWQGANEKRAFGLSIAAGLFTVAAFGGLGRAVLPELWTVPAHLACGVALLAAVRIGRLPDAVRRGTTWASGAVQALAVLWTLPVVGLVVLAPVGWASRAWTGMPSDARAALTVDASWPAHAAAVPVVLAAVGAVLVLLVRGELWRPRALTGALGLVWATVMTLPAVLELPYPVGLLIQGFTTVAVVAAAAFLQQPAPRFTALALALAASLSLAFLSLATQGATLTVLAVLVALFAAASWQSLLAPFTAPAALAYAAALACAVGAALGWQPAHTALLVLAVPVAAAVLAPRLGSPATVPVEAAGAAAGVLAIGLAATELPLLALVLALCGVIAAGTAIRPDRRSVGYVAAVLFVLATWVRLAAWEVGTPEAYTVPVSVPALLVGHLRRRREPRTSSWTAYGPGLAATLLPSLAAAWDDAHWTRPLLLGMAALSITLLGGGHGLKAPLVLGGTVLTLDALHELAPYLIQVADALPRWVPPALAGLLLLSLGATYEQRLRDARKMRDFLGSLR
ncbi:SCO7613 C-terminal domain-containing membrane protein [Streptomyces geranii]|uniref:SCO7613 C-terminal domain-containing membrane protein n=1 Tax=Streptomyces geranii TaxID=2058923 RepID=UPI000D02E6C1|nr:hypothetical protein [Streptomyces geranii]